MALNPFRRTSRANKVARNLLVADALYALFGSWSGSRRGKRRKPGRLGLLIGGASVAAAGVAGFLSRGKLARVLPGRSEEPAPPSAPVPPQPSNYDATGPVANTATPIPAPDPSSPGIGADGPPPRPVIDERAEEEAAAAEAAAIGGTTSDYAGTSLDEPADEELRPVVEAGGGESEGQEQAEAELADNATMRDQAPNDAERQIDDVIEAQDEPATGERPEPLSPLDADYQRDDESGLATPPGSEGGGISGRPGAALGDVDETPGVPATGSPATEPQTGDAPPAEGEGEGEGDGGGGGGEGGEPQTWSGRPA